MTDETKETLDLIDIKFDIDDGYYLAVNITKSKTSDKNDIKFMGPWYKGLPLIDVQKEVVAYKSNTITIWDPITNASFEYTRKDRPDRVNLSVGYVFDCLLWYIEHQRVWKVGAGLYMVKSIDKTKNGSFYPYFTKLTDNNAKQAYLQLLKDRIGELQTILQYKLRKLSIIDEPSDDDNEGEPEEE